MLQKGRKTMDKKIAIAGVVGALAVGAIAVATGAYAYKGDPSKTGPSYTPERHEAMVQAFENKDYAAWKEQVGDRGAARRIDEGNFARFAEMRKLMLEGKTAEAQAIRAELGLGQGNGKGMQSGQRGQNRGGNFVDTNNDGICDRMQ